MQDSVEAEEWDEVEDKMPRRFIEKMIRARPGSYYFKPAGIRMINLDEVVLTLSEFEAIRLVDCEGICQIEAGVLMRTSQSTLSRILASGRGKIADALVKGKAIKILN